MISEHLILPYTLQKWVPTNTYCDWRTYSKKKKKKKKLGSRKMATDEKKNKLPINQKKEQKKMSKRRKDVEEKWNFPSYLKCWFVSSFLQASERSTDPQLQQTSWTIQPNSPLPLSTSQSLHISIHHWCLAKSAIFFTIHHCEVGLKKSEKFKPILKKNLIYPVKRII